MRRSDRAGAATQARAVISARHTPIASHFRMVIRKHIVDPRVSVPPAEPPPLQGLTQVDRDLLLRRQLGEFWRIYPFPELLAQAEYRLERLTGGGGLDRL